MKLRNVTSGFIASALALSSFSTAHAQSNANRERPPQFIMMSFDGSYSIPFWQETKLFAEKYNVGFTYFISGVYFLSGDQRIQYQAPHHKPGKSDIGFGSNTAEIQQRIEEVVDAEHRDHEIGSHVNGHYDGSHWSYEDWLSEFTQFKRFIVDAFSINSISSPSQNDWENKVAKNIRGFRAPLLGVNEDMYKVMADQGFTYDASGMDYSGMERGRYNWPYKSKDGRWNFPLQGIKLAGTGKKTVTMDYNILVSQCNNEFSGSGATAACKNLDAEKLKAYEDETVETYIALFKKNYFGNRAPINIGHHFSLWNKGAYWKAMQRFAADVCTLEEVRCVTYKEMIQWLEGQNLPQVMSYQDGRFSKMPLHPLGLFGEEQNEIDLVADVQMQNHGEIVASVYGKDFKRLQKDGVSFQWKVDGNVVAESQGRPQSLHLTDEQSKEGKTISLSIRNAKKEILGTSRTLRQNSKDWIWLQNTGWEQRVMRGDLPEAHSETLDADLIQGMRVR